jgi:DNA gyrase subunit A
MDIIGSQIVSTIESVENELADDQLEEEVVIEEVNQGPWVLAITTGGYGKRVPIDRFRLQNRAGMGVRAIKFKSAKDQLAAIHIVNPEDELMIVTNRGIMNRQSVVDISLQSRMATGVIVQKMDGDDSIAAVALVPPNQEESEETT